MSWRCSVAGLAWLAAAVIGSTVEARQTTPVTQATKPAQNSTAKVALPAAVEAAFTKAYPHATIKNVSKETEHGRVQFEVESMDGVQARDLIYRPDGTLVLYEELIPASAVPAAVLSAVKSRYPKATIVRCEKLFQDGTMNYELALKGAAAKEVTLSPAGKWR